MPQATAEVVGWRSELGAAVGLNSSTGTRASRTTRSATLPSSSRGRPERPCVAIAIRSASQWPAYQTMLRAGIPADHLPAGLDASRRPFPREPDEVRRRLRDLRAQLAGQ